MRLKNFPKMSERSLYLAWNYAINVGEIPLEDRDGTQFLGIGQGLVLRVVQTTSRGFVLDIKMEDIIRAAYRKDTKYDLYALQPAKNPFRLE